MILENTALLLIDIQKGLDNHDYYGGARNNPNAEKNAGHILQKWRKLGRPIFHIQHSSQNIESPLHASKPGFEIKEEVKPLPSETVIVKNVNSAFIGTDLTSQLKSQNISSVIVVGLTTNHCVSTTARMSANLGFHTSIISDATAAFDAIGIDGSPITAEMIHLISLASLSGEFASIISTEALVKILEN